MVKLALLLCLVSTAAAQVITDKPTGTFLRLPNGDEVTTLTRPLPNKAPALKKDAFYRLFKTTESLLTSYTLVRTSISTTGTVTTSTVYIPKLRRTATTSFTLQIKSDYFYGDDGILYHRLDP